MIDHRGEPIIMDFGLARQLNKPEDNRLTQSGAILGSPAYMSPEQVEARDDIGPATDIYSLGVTLFELATGSLPFHEGNVPYHHVHTPPPDPREVNPKLPDLIAEIIPACMKKNPDERFQNAGEIVTQVKAKLSKGSSRGGG